MRGEDLEIFRGYVLYGIDERDLIERIVMFANGCGKLVFDKDLEEVAIKVCGDSARIEDLSSKEKVLEVLSRSLYVVTKVSSPVSKVKAVALIVGIRKRS